MAPRVLIATLATAVFLAANCSAAVVGFSESFSGAGPYSDSEGVLIGLDNDGWQLFVDDPASNSISPDGWRFEVETGPGDGSLQRLRRELEGTSSFTERLEFSGVGLGEVTPENNSFTGGHIEIQHLFEDRFDVNSSFSVFMLEPSVPDDAWLFVIARVGTQDDVVVPRATDFAIEVTYDQTASTVSATYLPAAAESEPISVFLPIDFPLLSSSSVRLDASSEGRNRVEATLHSWTLRPNSGVTGDINANGLLDVEDIDQLSDAILRQDSSAVFDVNDDGVVNEIDRVAWVHDLKQTYFGDSNLDGEFASSDLVNVFALGEYEDDTATNSTWSTGDWNGDGDFTTSDLVLAFQDGGYEHGPRVASAVPEPSSNWWGLCLWLVAYSAKGLRRIRSLEPSLALTPSDFLPR